MKAPAHGYQEFTDLLGEEELHELALKYGAAHQRERKLPIRIFFWLMVLSAGQSTARGGLFQLVAFFVGALTQLFPFGQALSLRKMALSKRMSGTSWFFFRAVYNRLLSSYEKHLPVSEKKFLVRFREAVVFDSTVTRVAAALEKCFQSVHKGQAAVKLHVRFSLKNLAANKVQATKAKRHDSRFRGITRQSGILYLFDLGYFAFARFQKIIAAKSFFVSTDRVLQMEDVFDFIEEDFHGPPLPIQVIDHLGGKGCLKEIGNVETPVVFIEQADETEFIVKVRLLSF